MYACGHLTQSVQHVVVGYVRHKAPCGFPGLCCRLATRTWLEELNIHLLMTGKRHGTGQKLP